VSECSLRRSLGPILQPTCFRLRRSIHVSARGSLLTPFGAIVIFLLLPLSLPLQEGLDKGHAPFSREPLRPEGIVHQVSWNAAFRWEEGLLASRTP
jgi:hypothetical protein